MKLKNLDQKRVEMSNMNSGGDQDEYFRGTPSGDTYLYHITPEENLPSILKEGLKPMVGETQYEMGDVEKRTPAVYFYPEDEWGYIPYLFEAFEAGKKKRCVLLRVHELALYGLKKGEEVDACTAYYFKLYNLPEEMCEPGEPGCAKIWEVWCTKSIPPEATEVVGRPLKPEREACRSA